MDSYPNEFIAHHAPLCFVAGLLTDETPAVAPQFSELVSHLTDALTPATGPSKGYPIWTSAAAHDIRCMLVHKNVRFPPLKARPQPPTASAPAQGQQPEQPINAPSVVAHSPISPLTPTSPLYPDGVIAPIWVRKHRELVPAVFVLVAPLYEHVATTDQGGPLAGPEARIEQEQAHDAALVRDILERKRSTTERGIKLAVVLLCSHDLIQDQALDVRLSNLRRQAGLDARASLFVLSPVSPQEVHNFVSSLKTDLYPAAVDYYREHGRRVRRKRARPGTAATRGKLSEKGWNARYDYKLGYFAEVRDELDVSLKHYEDSYDTLVDMFAAANLLMPRTKRWAEVKVLCDTLTVKIAKIYLLMNESGKSMGQLRKHIHVFRELSESWGIGEQTFEYWSWLTKQYRLMGDLLAAAIKQGYELPPSWSADNSSQKALPGSIEGDSSQNLLAHLQHPGFFYLFAARCTVQRRSRFREAEKTSAATTKLTNGDATTATQAARPPQQVSPALLHERKVDHAALANVLFGQASEQFERDGRRRMVTSIATETAEMHLSSGDSTAALALLQKAKPYRDSRWDLIRTKLAEQRLEAALAANSLTAAIEASLEVHVSPSTEAGARKENEQVLQNLFTRWAAEGAEEELILSPTESGVLIEYDVAFESAQANVGHEAKAQITFRTANRVALPFAFVCAYVHTSELDDDPIEVVHDDHAPACSTCKASAGPRTADLNLRFDGSDRVLEFGITGQAEQEIEIRRIELVLQVGEKVITVEAQQSTARSSSRWFDITTGKSVERPGLSPSCKFVPRQIQLDVQVLHDKPAYLDEEYDVTVEVVNTDSVAAVVTLEVLLQPGPDDAPNRLIVGDERFPAMIKDMSFGTIEPSQKTRRTFRLLSVGKIYERQLDLSIRAQNTDAPETTFTEIAKTVSVPVVPVLYSAFDVFLHPKRSPPQEVFDTSPTTVWENSARATVVVKLCAAGPWTLCPESVRLDTSSAASARVLASSLIDGQMPVSEWKPRDFFNAFFELQLQESAPDENAARGIVAEVLWRRKDSSASTKTTGRTRLALPPIKLSSLEPSILVTVPPVVVLHEPTTIKHTLTNPTARVLTLSLNIDSPAAPDEFVFSSSFRKIPRTILAPFESRSIDVTVVPLKVGQCSLPRVRVFEINRDKERAYLEEQRLLRESGSGRDGAEEGTSGTGTSSATFTKEWQVRSTSVVTSARDAGKPVRSTSDPLRVLVLPREPS